MPVFWIRIQGVLKKSFVGSFSFQFLVPGSIPLGNYERKNFSKIHDMTRIRLCNRIRPFLFILELFTESRKMGHLISIRVFLYNWETREFVVEVWTQVTLPRERHTRTLIYIMKTLKNLFQLPYSHTLVNNWNVLTS